MLLLLLQARDTQVSGAGSERERETRLRPASVESNQIKSKLFVLHCVSFQIYWSGVAAVLPGVRSWDEQDVWSYNDQVDRFLLLMSSMYTGQRCAVWCK